MKKTLSIMLSLFMLITTLSFGFCASANTASSATVLNLNETKTFTVTYDDYYYYMKFIPSKTGYYEFIATPHNGSNCSNLSLQLCDSSDSQFSEQYFNYSTNSCKIVYELEANQMYFIEGCNDTEGSITADIIVQQHTHTMKSEIFLKAEIGEDGDEEQKCKYCDYYKSITIPAIKTISLSSASYVYDGKVKTPTFVVKDRKGNTISKSYYTVSYSSGRKNVGKYSAKVTFKGKYYGSKTCYFYIKPVSTAISSISAGSKRFTAKWSKKSTQVTGYQIQYATNSKFSSAKTVTVGSYKTTSKTISKLSGKKKYYVRVRTYKKVGNSNIYSYWSKSKAITTKK